MDQFEPLHQFQRADIHLLGLDKAMMCEVRWTKTIQFRQKVLRFPVLPAHNKAICPVLWTHKMVIDNPGLPNDPLFLINTPQQKLCLLANQLLYRIRKWLKLVGQEDSAFSLHSLCRGGATFAYQSDMEGEMIKLLGGWASDCYKRYIDVSIDKRFDYEGICRSPGQAMCRVIKLMTIHPCGGTFMGGVASNSHNILVRIYYKWLFSKFSTSWCCVTRESQKKMVM